MSTYRLIAENQLVGTHGGAVFRNLYENAEGRRVSVKTTQDFDITKFCKLKEKYPEESVILSHVPKVDFTAP
jgi:hypothetical protein